MGRRAGATTTLIALVALAWAGNAAYAIGTPGGALKFWSPAVVAASMIGYLVLHGGHRYGRALLARFVAIVFAIAWIAESVSVLTGFPFGSYHYTEHMWPFIGHVPVFVLPAYAIMGYASWSLACILAGRFSTGLDARGARLVPVLAAALMVAWDLSMDPLRATVEGRWIWSDGGIHLGVPAVNYAGWFLVTWAMFGLFARTIRRRSGDGNPVRAPRLWWVSVPLIYLAFAVEYLLNPVIGQDAGFILLGGEPIAVSDIYQAVALTTLVTMVPPSLFGLMRLAGVGRSARARVTLGPATGRNAATGYDRGRA